LQQAPASRSLGGRAEKRPHWRPILESLEGRVVLDSGGAVGQFTAAADNLAYFGGPLIQSVQIEPIFLKDSGTGKVDSASFQASIDAYFNAITTDSFIPSLVSPYSVPADFHGHSNPAYTISTGSKGADDVGVSITPNGTVGRRSVSDTQFTSIILSEIRAGHTAANNANTLYFLFTPPGDAVTAGSSNSIDDFFGYHSAFPSGSTWCYYAVIPDQSITGPNGNYSGYGLTTLQGEEVVSSHEMAEAITDPVLASGFIGWQNPKFGGDGEVGDLAANETYTLDGNQVQSLWSNSLIGPAHSPGASGQTNVFINQLSPPAVPVSAGTSVPVATFTDPAVVNDPSAFAAYAYLEFDNGTTSNFWSMSVSGGADGVYVINGRPSPAVATGQVGSFDNQTGLFVSVYQKPNNPFDQGTPTGKPLADRYQPFDVTSTAPLYYNADNGLMSADGNLAHNFRLVKRGTNFNLYDNGQLVFVQPTASTTSINILTDPDSVDSSLTIDYSGGTFTNNVKFDGGTGAGTHVLTLENGTFSTATYSYTGAGSGTITIGSQTITFSDTSAITDNDTVTNDVLNLPAGSVGATLQYDGKSQSQLATTNGSFVSTTFTEPTSSLTVNDGGGSDTITVASTAAATAVAINGGGGTDTLVGSAGDNTWSITDTNTGTLVSASIAGPVSFNRVQNLTGGAASNTFVFSDGAGVDGNLDGGGGGTLDYSAYSSSVIVDLQTGFATGVGGSIANVQNLTGGNGGGAGTYNILVGNGGNLLTGGTGRRNLLIAGASASRLIGGDDDDILIGGTTACDTDLASLTAIMDYWSGTSDDYGTRVGNLLSGNGVPLLNPSTVTSNSGGNMLLGGGGLNLYYGNALDTTDFDPNTGAVFVLI
jgi:hypothetical protein